MKHNIPTQHYDNKLKSILNGYPSVVPSSGEQAIYGQRGSIPNKSCYYKCELSALPGKLCHRFYIFRREVAHWLQFGVTINFLRAIITIIKK